MSECGENVHQVMNHQSVKRPVDNWHTGGQSEVGMLTVRTALAARGLSWPGALSLLPSCCGYLWTLGAGLWMLCWVIPVASVHHCQHSLIATLNTLQSMAGLFLVGRKYRWAPVRDAGYCSLTSW